MKGEGSAVSSERRLAAAAPLPRAVYIPLLLAPCTALLRTFFRPGYHFRTSGALISPITCPSTSGTPTDTATLAVLPILRVRTRPMNEQKRNWRVQDPPPLFCEWLGLEGSHLERHFPGPSRLSI